MRIEVSPEPKPYFTCSCCRADKYLLKVSLSNQDDGNHSTSIRLCPYHKNELIEKLGGRI